MLLFSVQRYTEHTQQKMECLFKLAYRYYLPKLSQQTKLHTYSMLLLTLLFIFL